MGVRKRLLPQGWYPETAEETRREIAGMRQPAPAPGSPACAGILPHAGWHFSGRLALEVLTSLARGIDTIVIIGGHMGSTDGIVSVFDDAYETPLGELKADLALLDTVRASLYIREDRERDNTVEVHLPFVRFLAPEAMVLGMRAPPSMLAVPRVDEDAVRADIRATLEATRGCVLEILMKDNHTLGRNPDNLVQWVRIAREEIEDRWGG